MMSIITWNALLIMIPLSSANFPHALMMFKNWSRVIGGGLQNLHISWLCKWLTSNWMITKLDSLTQVACNIFKSVFTLKKILGKLGARVSCSFSTQCELLHCSCCLRDLSLSYVTTKARCYMWNGGSKLSNYYTTDVCERVCVCACIYISSDPYST